MSDVTVTEDGSTVTINVSEPVVSVGTPAIVSASAVPFTPTGGIAATNVQSAIAELDAEKQPLDAELTALAALTSAVDTVPYFTGLGTAALASLTAFGRSLIAGIDAAAVRSTLGLGSLALASTITASQISDSTAAGRTLLTAADASAQLTALGIPSLATSGISGALTLSKTGTTARTATFPDAAITVAGINLAQTWTAAQTFSLATSTLSLAVTGDSGTNGSLSKSASAGLKLIATTGSAYDAALLNVGSSAYVWRVPTGTSDFHVIGSMSAAAITATGAVTVPNGSAAAPGLRLTSEASGLFRNTSTSMGISVAGVAMMYAYAPTTGFGGIFQFNQPVSGDVSQIYNVLNDGAINIRGGTFSAGGTIKAYGGAHGTKPNAVELCHADTVKFSINATGIGFFGTTPVARPSLAAASGTATRTTFDTTTVTTQQLAERVKAIIDDLRGYGLEA